MKPNPKILLFLTFLLALFLRAWQVGQNPTFISDEASIGYNAYSILKTGKDEWGKFLPLTFKSFGEYKLPFYIYLTVPSVFVFGLNELAMRFPSILFGSLTIVAVYFLVKELFLAISPRRGAAGATPLLRCVALSLVASFLLAISPWHIQVSRMALEANLSLFIIVLATLFFLKGLKEKRFFYLSFILYALTFYTYNACRVFVPLLLLGMILVFRQKRKKSLQALILSICLAFVLLIPVIFTGFRGTGERIAKVGILSDPGIIMRINEQRNSCLEIYPQVFCRLLYNRPLIYTQVFLKNYSSHFSPIFLFLKGSGLAQYSVPERGMVYLFELPFLILGIFWLVKFKKAFLTLLLWLLLAPLANSFTGQAHPVRAIFLLPVFQIFTAGGLVFVFDCLGKIKWAKILFAGVLALVILVSLKNFLIDYFVFYPLKHTSTWQAGYKQLYLKLADLEKNYEKIYISKFYGEPHIFYLFYQKFDPKRYQENKEVIRYDRPDQWANVDRIGKYFFIQEVTPQLLGKENLLAVPPSEVLSGVEILGQIKYKDGETAFVITKIK